MSFSSTQHGESIFTGNTESWEMTNDIYRVCINGVTSSAVANSLLK